MVDFATVVAGEEILEEHINQIISWLNGDDASYYAAASIIANSSSDYTLTARNTGTGGKSFRLRDSTNAVDMIAVDDGGASIRVAAGSVGTPGVRISTDTDTGVYSYAANQLGISAGGTAALVVTSSALYAGMDGSAAGPAWTWLTDGTAGMRRVSTGYAALSSTGTDRVLWNATGVGFNGQAPAARPDYTVSNPSTDRVLDVTGDTTAQVAAVVGTLIADLIALGLLQ